MRPLCSWSLYNGTTHFGRQESLAPRSATSSGKKKKLCSMRRYIWVWLISICTYIHIPWSTCTYTGCPKKMTKSKPKLSAVGPNFPMNLTWERLILLSLSKKWPKNIFPDKGVISARAPWFEQHSISHFFRTSSMLNRSFPRLDPWICLPLYPRICSFVLAFVHLVVRLSISKHAGCSRFSVKYKVWISKSWWRLTRTVPRRGGKTYFFYFK